MILANSQILSIGNYSVEDYITKSVLRSRHRVYYFNYNCSVIFPHLSEFQRSKLLEIYISIF